MREHIRMPEEDAADQIMPVTLRAVTDGDEAFLIKTYTSVRADELAQVPWSQEQREAFIKMQFDAQLLHYKTHNPNATYEIILLDTHAIGRLYVARRDQEIRILDLTILPEHRNRGIGTSLLKNLMTECVDADKPLTIYVENYNPSYRLFQRLGFNTIDESDEVNHLLEWRA
jgi:ribosomal protein S18 acetylase RimI-like enzyme